MPEEEKRRIYHPSHPHPLVPVTLKSILCECDACDKRHEGIFYHCITCLHFSINHDCAFLPKKLFIQRTTKEYFSHTHPLTLSYSFRDRKAKFYPRCRVCSRSFIENLFLYKCDKCRYYTHVDCATSRSEPFMSLFLPAGRGKTLKNFEDADYPDLVHLPFLDETYSILKQHFFQGNSCGNSTHENKSLTHFSHIHPLVLVDGEISSADDVATTTSRINTLSLHNPMKKIQLLCNGCVRPIMEVPFYKCTGNGEHCNFVLHDWCTQRLPSHVQNHPGHPEHDLILLPNAPSKIFGVFWCDICKLPCNGFAYGCIRCEYYIDVNCGFIPEKVMHEAHPNHLLSRKSTSIKRGCDACFYVLDAFSFHCDTCDFVLHTKCAMLLPGKIRHKYDKHPLNLSYAPIENHKSEYFCEICEEEFDPERWFYHCSKCAQSIHPACAPLVLQSEYASRFYEPIYEFVNIKFGGILNIEGHPHPLSFVQGVKSDGNCSRCEWNLQYKMIFKCIQCKFVLDYKCATRLSF